MANGGAGSRGGLSKSTFYRTWRENQLRQRATDDHGPYTLVYGIKRADLERVLQEEQSAREADRKAITISYAEPTLEELLKRVVSPLKAWREIRGITVAELEAATGISQKVLHQIENRTRRHTSQQAALLAQALSICSQDI
jgi:ribosome-binding protein aMBF1 (putative translation factor)